MMSEAIKERPILFSGAMVRAILDGTKTQTRRVLKLPRLSDTSWIESVYQDGGGNWIAWSSDSPTHAEFTKKAYPNGEGFHCPHGKVGDRLWVRETFFDYGHWACRSGLWTSEADDPSDWYWASSNDLAKVRYAADDPADIEPLNGGYGHRKMPSIFMPRWASRDLLHIKAVRVERVRDISSDDAEAEGVEWKLNPNGIYQWEGKEGRWHDYPQDAYRDLWDSINKARGFGWESNPWVWVITYERIEP
jgi:hypothetical protein